WGLLSRCSLPPRPWVVERLVPAHDRSALARGFKRRPGRQPGPDLLVQSPVAAAAQAAHVADALAAVEAGDRVDGGHGVSPPGAWRPPQNGPTPTPTPGPQGRRGRASCRRPRRPGKAIAAGRPGLP